MCVINIALNSYRIGIMKYVSFLYSKSCKLSIITLGNYFFSRWKGGTVF